MICRLAGGALAVLLCVCTPVASQVLPTYPLSASESSSAWYPDRYAPSVFSNSGSFNARNNVLDLGVAAADGQTTRPSAFSSSFYNTQGRKIYVGTLATSSWIGSLYIPSAWAAPSSSDGSGSRRSDLWATVSPTTGGDTCAGSNCNLFPIIDFDNALFPDGDNQVGGTPRYRVFDENNGGWIDLPTPVTYDAWTDFCVTFTGSEIQFLIGNTIVYTAANLTQGDTSFGPVTTLNNAMVQAYNYGYTYDAQWSNLAAGQASCNELRSLFAPKPPPAPVPALDRWLLAALGLLLFVAALRIRASHLSRAPR